MLDGGAAGALLELKDMMMTNESKKTSSNVFLDPYLNEGVAVLSCTLRQ